MAEIGVSGNPRRNGIRKPLVVGWHHAGSDIFPDTLVDICLIDSQMDCWMWGSKI